MKNYRILNLIDSPEMLKQLPSNFLTALCAEIRDLILSTTAQNGGHLASNLGVVELTVALHRVFSTPEDEIVWDVGHQCYTHKILTGRRDAFPTLRQQDGLSGFPKHKESPHDAFLAGHAGTAISVACGIAQGKRLQGDTHHVIAVVGDGAFTSGLAYEGLTNAAYLNSKLIVILNDNEMSISKNVGALGRYLAIIRSKPAYFRAKDAVEQTLDNLPIVGGGIKNLIVKSKSIAKNMLYHSNFFEELGFVYLGPVDGHDIENLTDVLTRAKALDKPVFIHIETKKGKGYPFAEQNPGAHHGVSSFDPQTGCTNKKTASGFSEEFGKYITYLGMKDKRICAITAAMKHSTGLHLFDKHFKGQGRFFDVEIAEPHAVAFAAGLATKGLLPVFAVYSSFLQRAYDQVLHDLSIEPQHVVLAVDRAGIVGDDGETHQGLFDVSILCGIPGMTVYSPSTYKELRCDLKKAIYKEKGVVAVRYPRGEEEAYPEEYVANGRDYTLQGGTEGNLIITYGRTICQAIQAVELLRTQGIEASVLHLNKIFPLDQQVILLAKKFNKILFVEEGIRKGSVAEHMASRLMEVNYRGKYKIRAIENHFVAQAKTEIAFEKLGFDGQSIANYFVEIAKKKTGGKR